MRAQDDHPSGKPPRRHFAGALATFMEARNILWGELVGGLLVVGCSIALIVSLWQTFRDNPLFKFCAFTGAVAGVYGAGLYTLRRWKLESTSRGLLLIALFLTPLDLLALTLSTARGAAPLDLPVQAASLLALGWLAWRAARVLAPHAAGHLAVALTLVSACLVPIARLADRGMAESRWLMLGFLPVVCFIACAGSLFVRSARQTLDGPRALSLFLFLGGTAFALVLALGMLVFRASDAAVALGRLALPLALAGLPPLALGALVHRGLGSERRWATQRMTGTTVALAGMVLMLLALGLAWPRPVPVLVVCALDFLALTLVAFCLDLPVAHAVALPCLACGYAVVSFFVSGLLPVLEVELPERMLAAVTAPVTGVALLLLFALCGVATEGIARVGALAHARFYALGSVGIVLVSLALVTPTGLTEPGRALAAYAVAGTGILILNLRWRRDKATCLGLGLMIAASLWGLWKVHGRIQPDWGTVLAAEALLLGLLNWWLHPIPRHPTNVVWLDPAETPYTWVSVVTACAAVALAGWTGVKGWWETGTPWALAHVGTAACLAILGTVRGVTERQTNFARLGSWAFLGVVILGAGWMAQVWGLYQPSVLIAGCLAGTSLLLAAGAVSLSRQSVADSLCELGKSAPRWGDVLVPAWREASAFVGVLALLFLSAAPEVRWHVVTLVILSLAAFLLAWSFRVIGLTWVGSTLLLAAVAHLLIWDLAPYTPPHPLLAALLAQATLVLSASVLGGKWVRYSDGHVLLLRRVIVDPLRHAAMLSAFFVVQSLFKVGEPLIAMSVYALWAAGLLLIMAWIAESPPLFTLFQIALTFAVVEGSAAWLEQLGWGVDELRSLQGCGIGLALLSLAWVVIRARMRPDGTLAALSLWCPVDRLVLGALVLLQLGVALFGIAQGVIAEMGPREFGEELQRSSWMTLPLTATGWSAWLLLALLAVTLAIEARVRLCGPVVVGLLLLAMTIPVLTAGRFAPERATASALRWGLGACFLACSLPLWLRDRLAPTAGRWGLEVGPPFPLAPLARHVLVGTMAIPVVAFAVLAALSRLYGVAGPGPESSSMFSRMGRLYAGLVPLAMVCVGLVIHALRERLPGYAFTVGIGGNLMASLIVRAYHRTDPLAVWWVPLVQANAIAFGSMALLWMATRRRLYGPRGSGNLLVLQIGLGLAANACLLGTVLQLLFTAPVTLSTQAGSVWGWLGFALAAGAALWFAWAVDRDHMLHHVVPLLLGIGVLLAAAGPWSATPWLAFRVLTVAWALTAAGLLAGGWLVTTRISRAPDGWFGWLPPPEFVARLGGWVAVTGALLLGLALRGWADDPLAPRWTCGIVLVVSGLAAGLARWQRREGWAFVAGLMVNVAVCLFLLHGTRPAALEHEWVHLLQANLIAAAVVALVWLAVTHRLYGAAPAIITAAPLLTLQVVLLLAGNAALLAVPALDLIQFPEAPPLRVAQAGALGGWLALLTSLAAAAWYVRRLRRAEGAHLFYALALALGVLAAGTVARHTGGAYVAYHVLTATWAATAAALLAAGWLGHRRRTSSSALATLFPARAVVPWVVAFGAAVLALGLRGMAGDPLAPWWPAGTAVAVAALAGGLALWRRREGWAFTAGLCLNLAVSLVLWHYGAGLRDGWVVLLQANTLMAGVAAILWLAGRQGLLGAPRLSWWATPFLSTQVLLALAGNLALLLHGCFWLIYQPDSPPESVGMIGTSLGGVALVAALAALLWHLGPLPAAFRMPSCAGIGLALSIHTACAAADWYAEDWLAYHTLLVAWGATAALVLAVGWTALRRVDPSAWGVIEDPSTVRSVLACVTAVGVLVLALALRAVGDDPGRPWWSSGPVLFLSVLAALLAYRRRQETWAFVASLGVHLAVSLVVMTAHPGEPLERWWVVLVQANTIAGGLCALTWLLTSRHLQGPTWTGLGSAPLLGVELALLLAGNAALLLGPLALLIARPGALAETVVQAGHQAGWLSLLLTVAVACCYAGRLPHRGSINLLCGLGLALGVLVACTAARLDGSQWIAYHVLTAAWALLGVLILALAWRLTPDVAPRGGVLATGWVAVVGALVLALGLRGLTEDPLRPWWPAGTALGVGLLYAAVALWRRREEWAFLGSLGVYLAVTLVVCGIYAGQALLPWWVGLLQANVLAGAAATYAWLLAARRLYGAPQPLLSRAPLLFLQVGALLATSTGLLVGPAAWLIANPRVIDPIVTRAGSPLGWLTLAAAGGVAVWHFRLYRRRPVAQGVAALGVAFGILAACTAAHWDTSGQWLAYHVLTVTWAATGLVVLARSRLRPVAFPDAPTPPAAPALPWTLDASIAAVGVLVLSLAVRGMAGDPAGPWWCIAAVLAVCMQAAVLAVWRRSETWAFVATLCLDLAVSLLVWDLQRQGAPETWWVQLLQANVISGCVAALLWAVSNRRAYAERPAGMAAAPLVTTQAFVSLAATAVLLINPALVALVLNPGDVPDSVRAAAGVSGWLTLLLTVAVAVVQLRLTRMQGGVQVLGSLGVAAGVLIACTAAQWDHGNWLAYHVLLVSWVALAGLMLLGGWLDARWRLLARLEDRDPDAPVVSEELVREWVTLVGLPVLGLVLRAVLVDPTGAWWSAGALLGLSLLAGLVAAWQGRERWALAAGLGVNLAFSLVLWRDHYFQPLEEWWLPLVRGNVLACSLVAFVWLALSRRRTSSPLLGIQIALGLLGNLVLLTVPAWLLVRQPAQLAELVAQAGDPVGWLSLVFATAAAAWHLARSRSPGSVHLVMALGLALGVLAACTAARFHPGDYLPYHVLLAAWALLGWAVVATGWALDRGATAPTSSLLPGSVARDWAVRIGVLVLALALRAVLDDPAGPWWSAGGVLAVSVLAALVAAWQRREAPAFAAALGVNLAVSLILWRLHYGQALETWWLPLAQANLLATAGAALAWLLLSRFLYDEVSAQKGAPLLGVQTLLAPVGAAALFAYLAAVLVARPDLLAVAVVEAGEHLSWLTLGLAVLPAAWYLTRRAPGALPHLLIGTGLGVGVLAACTGAARTEDSWLAYHVLTASWASLGLVVLAGAGVASRRAPFRDEPPTTPAVREGFGQAWVAILAALVLVLALRTALIDPTGPYWPAGAVVAVSIMAAGLALWQRREGWAFLAALGINLAVTLVIRYPHRPEPLASWWGLLVHANITASALAALLWLGVRGRVGSLTPDGSIGPLLTVQVLLGVLGNALLLIGPGMQLVLWPEELQPGVRQAGGVWGWPALAVALLPPLALTRLLRSRAGLHMLGGLALCVAVLAACTVGAGTDNSWHAYHTLTGGIAVAGCLALAAAVRLAQRELMPPADLLRGWAITFGIFLLILACRAAALRPTEPFWSAAAVLVVAGLAAGLAAWQREEGWAFVAGLLLNLSTSFLLWGIYHDKPLADWWLPLLQLNVAVTALTALAWSFLARHAAAMPAETPLLGVQVILGLVGNIVLLASAGLLLFARPNDLAPIIGQAGHVGGWVALLLALAAAFHHFGAARAVGPVPVAGLLGLLGGVLVACTVAALSRQGWAAYHFLTLAWATAGPALLAAAWWSTRRPVSDTPDVRPRFYAGPVVEWAWAFGMLTLLLAVRGAASDPGSPWWAAGPILATGGLAAALAVWQRREGWAFIAGLCGNLAVTLLVAHAHQAQALADWLVPLVQANVMTSAVASLAWIAALRRLRAADGPPTSPLLTLQVALLLLGNALLLVQPAVVLVVWPGDLTASVAQAGHIGGWLSLLLALAAAGWYAGRTMVRGALHVLCGLGLALGVLAACTAAQWDPKGQHWLAFHVLLAAWALVALLTLTLGWMRTLRAADTTTSAEVVQAWVTGMTLLLVGLALRAAWVDPNGPWWSAGVLLTTAILAGALAFWSRQAVFVNWSGLALVAAGLAFATGWGYWQPFDLVHVGLLSLALAAGLWSVLESLTSAGGQLRGEAPHHRDCEQLSLPGLTSARSRLRGEAPPFPHVGTLVPLAVLLGLVAIRVAAWAVGMPSVGSPLAWPLLLAITVALLTSLWDETARFGLAGLYAVGAAALGLALADVPPAYYFLSAAALALFVTMTTCCWYFAERARSLAAGFGLPTRPGGWPTAWFPPTQAVLAAAAVILSLWVCLTRTDTLERFAGPLAVALLLPAALIFAAALPDPRRSTAQFATLLVGALALVEAAWAPLNLNVPSPWLQRTGMLLTVSALLTIGYGVLLPRLLPPGSDWRSDSLRASALLAVSALALVVVVVVQEVILTRMGVRPLMNLPALLAVVFALTLLIVAGVCFAVRPGLDPFALPEKRRTGYVYLGEILLVVLFAHLRLTAPEWFRGSLGKHWTFVVLAIAFFGAGVSEVLGRLGVRVLAEPLRRTGAFLPLLPVLAFWVRPTEDNYAALWFTVGLFYAMLAVLERSMAFALLGALGFNIGLWVVLHENQVAFLRYPQLWLVPFAMTVLVAAHINRDRLGRAQTTTLRYLALTVIYLASTAETFVSGLGHDASRPLILIGLSLAGVFAGMLLRIRAFLFLGSGFVGLGIFALVWHAAENKSWLWYVAGIALGVVIIVLFAIFEKRRNDVLRLLEKLREWE